MDENFKNFFLLLQRWNRTVRLVSDASDFDAFYDEHVRDVIELSGLLSGVRNIIDLGTGAGIPGILIKIARPEIKVALLDSVRKKVSFCDEAIRQLGLSGIEAVCGRAEDPETMRRLGRFDAVVSRATWKMSEMLDKTITYMNDGDAARIIAMKGDSWHVEYREAKGIVEANGLKIALVHDYALRDGRRRSIVMLGRDLSSRK
jgi:16S rRNA (guanine527-N7)-methyltransferase